jgi:uncharacterized membrane protein YeiH
MAAPDLAQLLPIIDHVAVGVFAVTGALVASRKEMDVFGFALLGTATGIGGGTLRDVLLGHLPVFWVQRPSYVAVCVAASVAVFFTAHLPESRYRVLLWLDAVGLALFSVAGADRVLMAGGGPFVAVVMGVVTATFGGIIRDVLGGESPLLLRREIYVTAALAGALSFVLLASVGVGRLWAGLLGFVVCFVIRALALVYRWSLPPYKARPGREPHSIGL